MGLVLCSLPLSLQCWRKSRLRDRAMDEIHKLLPRLYRFTKIPYAQCTLLKKSKDILWEEELEDESTYNLCFQWSQLGEDASSHTETNTAWGPGSDFMLMQEDCSLVEEHSTIMNMEPANCFFVRSPVGSIAVVLFSLSCSLTLLMPLPQVAWQHNSLQKKKKSKEKVKWRFFFKNYTYMNNQSDCSQWCVQKN